MEFAKGRGLERQVGAKGWSMGLTLMGLRVREGFQAWVISCCCSYKHCGGETRERLGSRVLIRGN